MGNLSLKSTRVTRQSNILTGTKKNKNFVGNLDSVSRNTYAKEVFLHSGKLKKSSCILKRAPLFFHLPNFFLWGVASFSALSSQLTIGLGIAT